MLWEVCMREAVSPFGRLRVCAELNLYQVASQISRLAHIDSRLIQVLVDYPLTLVD